MNTSDFKPGTRVKIVDLTGWDTVPDAPADLLGKYGSVIGGAKSNVYVDVEVENLEGTRYEPYIGRGILFLPSEIEVA
jgi:hypothetical protein